MDEDTLKLYLPAYGDRVPTTAFCKSKCKTEQSSAGNFSESLQELRRKWKSGHPSAKSNSSKGFKHGNVCGKKLTRRVEMGWMDFNMDTKTYKQVRLKSGGGVRHRSVEKTIQLSQLLVHALDTFFPEGVSKKGNLDEFNVELKDFQGLKILDMNKTVEDVYKESNLKILRVYLYTRAKFLAEVTTVDDISTPDVGTSDVVTPVVGTPDVGTPDVGTSDVPVVVSGKEHAALCGSQDGKTTCNDIEMGTPTVVVNEQKLLESYKRAAELTSEDSHDSDCELCLPPPLVFARRKLLSLQRQRKSSDNEEENHTDQAKSSSDQPVSNLQEHFDSNDQALEELEEDDIQMAIKASLESSRPAESFEDILRNWMQVTLKEGTPQTILLQRGKVLSGTLRAVAKPTFRFDHPIKVVYAGEDYGGPRREFLRELMQDLQDYILIGPVGNKQFSHNIQKVSENRYFTAGQLVAFSVLHGGPSLPVLNPVLYKLITNTDFDMDEVTDESILDDNVRNRIKQIEESQNQSELTSVLNKDAEWYLDLGVFGNSVKFVEKERFLKTLISNELMYKVQSELTQFMDGMNSIGCLFQTVMRQPEVMKKLFVNITEKLTFESFRSLYEINFSPEGSNQRLLEQDTVYSLECFIMDSEAGETGVTLEHLLSFWTGAEKRPPLGFEKKLEVNFINCDDEYLPVARTCGMVLELKRGEKDAERFREKMAKAVLWTEGFHIA